MKKHNGSVGINGFPNRLQPTFKNASGVLGWSSDPVPYITVTVHSPVKRIDLLKCSLRFTDKGHNFLFRVDTLERQHGLQETKHKLISYQNSQLLPHMLEQFILVRYPLQWSKTSCYLSPMYMSQIETPLQEQRRRKRETSVVLN